MLLLLKQQHATHTKGKLIDQKLKYRLPHYWFPSPTDATLIGAVYPGRVQRLVRRGAVLNTLCKGQGQGQVRSPKVIC